MSQIERIRERQKSEEKAQIFNVLLIEAVELRRCQQRADEERGSVLVVRPEDFRWIEGAGQKALDHVDVAPRVRIDHVDRCLTDVEGGDPDREAGDQDRPDGKRPRATKRRGGCDSHAPTF
jgi:hypothetical protein